MKFYVWEQDEHGETRKRHINEEMNPYEVFAALSDNQKLFAGEKEINESRDIGVALLLAGIEKWRDNVAITAEPDDNVITAEVVPTEQKFQVFPDPDDPKSYVEVDTTPSWTPEGPFKTRESLLKLFDYVVAKSRSLMEGKNHDYTSDGNPFANFEASKAFGIKPEIGILIRLTDKLKRIETFLRVGKVMIKAESMEDAVCDGINYLILLLGKARTP